MTIIYGTTGADKKTGSSGNDTVYGWATGGNASSVSGNDTLNGAAGNDTIFGGTNNDSLIGGTDNDLLDGGFGSDRLNGGTGNDIYVINTTSDIITESSGAGTDKVQSSVSYTLGSNVENLTLTGTSSINGTGNSLNNTITGNAANNTLNGGTGNDTLVGGVDHNSGNDTLYGGDRNDQLISKNVRVGSSYEGADRLYGGNGDDRLNGGAGANNTLEGGSGNDTYTLFTTADTIVEAANGGTDTVLSPVSYTLGSNLENLTLTGTGTSNGIGNRLNNRISGNAAKNSLNGGKGNDTLDGGLGNDILIASAGSDILTGGLGQDHFTFNTYAPFKFTEIGQDKITDFTIAIDKIVLDRTTFTALKSVKGNGFSNSSEFAIVSNDAAATTTSALIVYNKTNSKLFYNQNRAASGLGSGGVFATLTGNPSLSASDFLVQDSSQYSLTSSSQEVNEGDVITFSLKTSYVPVGTRIDYTIDAVGITASDFLHPQFGSFIIGDDGSATVQVKVNADRNTEGVEHFTLKLNNNRASATIKIDDTSTTPIPTVTSISRTFSRINEGITAQFIVNTTNFAANTNLNYRIVGLNSDDIVNGALTGVVTIGADGKGIINILIAEDHALEGSELLDVAIDYIRNGSSTTIQSEGSTEIADTSTPDIFGTDSNDTLIGSSFRDLIWGKSGDDLLEGREQDDQLVGHKGADVLLGGAGKDLLIGNEGADTLEGGDGDDYLYLGDNNLVADIETFEGEKAVGGEGNDYIVGTILSIGDNFSTIYELIGDGDSWSPTGGNDTIFGGNGFGAISGSGGNDVLYAYKAYDGNLFGGHGDDILYAGYAHAVTGGPGYDRAYLLGNVSDYWFERNSDTGSTGLAFGTSKYIRPDGSKFYYFLADVEEFVMADGIVHNTEQFIKDQKILWPGRYPTSIGIDFTLSSTNQSIIPGIPSISLSKTFGTPDMKKAISKNLLDIGNSTIGAKIGANLSVDAKLEAYMEGGFSLGAIDTVIPVNGSITAARSGSLVSVDSRLRFPSGASYQVKEPSAFFKAGIRGHLQANASIDVDAWANIPAVTVPNPFGDSIEITPAVNLKIDQRLGLPASLTKRFDIEELIGGPFININALNNPSYSYSFPNGSITAEIPLISFSNNGGTGDYLSGAGLDPFLTLNFDVASFIAEKTPIPLAYTFDKSFKTPSIAGYRAEAGILAKASVLKADLIATASLVEEITVDFVGFRTDFTIDGQTGPQDHMLYYGGTTQFGGSNDLNGDGLLSVAATLEPVVNITNRTYIDLDVDLGVALPNLEYEAWANVAGTGARVEGSLSAFSQKFDLFNTDLPLFTKAWELGGFASQQVDFGAI